MAGDSICSLYSGGFSLGKDVEKETYRYQKCDACPALRFHGSEWIFRGEKHFPGQGYHQQGIVYGI